MAEILTNSATLRQKAATLEQLNANFKAAVAQLEGVEQNLMSMWDGDAKNSFHTAFNNDKAQMDNFYKAVVQYVKGIESMAANYDNAENKNVSTAQTRKY